MTIAIIEPVPIGNAVRVILSRPDDSTLTRVLRNTSGTFSGATPGANDALVFEGQDSGFIDATGLANGTIYHYAAFDRIDGAWVSAGAATCTPAATSSFVTDDVLTIVADRLRAGLKVAVGASALQHENGAIPVLTAPPVYENTKFPVVSVHLRNDSPAEWGIGDFVGGDSFDTDGGVAIGATGWLSSVTLDIYGWVVANPDTRIALRRVIHGILIGNLEVFEAAGLTQFSISQSDQEDFESYAAPVYQVVTTFSCLAPSVVTAPCDPPLGETVLAIPYDL